jgi:TrmH family RNA methyltransferase
MLSKATIKFIKSLQVKKYRKQEQCFVVEGAKSIRELLASDFRIRMVIGTSDFLQTITVPKSAEAIAVTEKELEGLGEFQSNNSAVAVAEIAPNDNIVPGKGEYALVLDDIRDPGNLGTIIRTADWYGMSSIICSEQTADFYNSKVISATMGSFVRVKAYYTDLAAYLSATTLPVYGAFLEGEDVHKISVGKRGGLILIGSESHGISADLERFVTTKITIPRVGAAESLNAAIATAIICDNIMRLALTPDPSPEGEGRPSPLALS